MPVIHSADFFLDKSEHLFTQAFVLAILLFCSDKEKSQLEIQTRKLMLKD